MAHEHSTRAKKSAPWRRALFGICSLAFLVQGTWLLSPLLPGAWQNSPSFVLVPWLAPLHFWLLPQLALLLALLFSHRPKLLAGLWVCISVLLSWQILQPAWNQSSGDQGKVQLLTYNIYGGAAGLPTILQDLRGCSEAVWLLQECTQPWHNKSKPDPYPVLVRAFPERHFSRCPQQPELVVSSPQTISDPEIVFMGKGVRPAYAVTTTVAGQTVRLLNTHFSTSMGGTSFSTTRRKLDYLSMTVKTRQLQFHHLGQWLQRTTGPLVVAGDFNTPPLFPGWLALETRCQDSFAAGGRGSGWTYPSSGTQIRLDYLWVEGLDVQRCWVPTWKGSDHLPVLATLRTAQMPSKRGDR